MNEITVTQDGFVVDATLIGRAFAIAPELVQDELRNGRLTSRSETGVDEDEGRWRLTFYRGGSALRLVVDASGGVLSQSTFPVAQGRQQGSR